MDAISLGTWKQKGGQPIVLPSQNDKEATYDSDTETLRGTDEGTPEDIRKRFFPSAPQDDPALEWIQSTKPASLEHSTAPSTLRFDLTGTPITESLSATLPTHLGLHHHSEGDHAGYSLEDIFMLSRSTVPAQRTTMFEVMDRIAQKLVKREIPELLGQEESLRLRMVLSGIDAIDARGTLGVAAIDVVWTSVVGWNDSLRSIEGVELENTKSADPASPLADVLSVVQPEETLLPKVARIFAAPALPPESVSRVLDILHRFAQQSDQDAAAIVAHPGLVRSIFQTTVLTPIPPSDDSLLPDPIALHLVRTLIQSSQTNASALLGPVDALLRFVVTLPPSSPYAPSLASSLLMHTLQIYKDLAAYGRYSHIATTATEHLSRLATYVLSDECQSTALKVAWLELVEAWVVCATDPHQTTPEHDILWTQVTGWGWGADVLDFARTLDAPDQSLWSPIWRVLSAWLEGSRVNGVKGGEAERLAVLEVCKDSFENGIQANVVATAGETLDQTIDGLDTKNPQSCMDAVRRAGGPAQTLASAMRLWLACLPPQTQVAPDTPPFILPFTQLSALCGKIVSHSLWRTFFSDAVPEHFLRRIVVLLPVLEHEHLHTIEHHFLVRQAELVETVHPKDVLADSGNDKRSADQLRLGRVP